MGPTALFQRYDIHSIYGVNFGGSGFVESTEETTHASSTIKCPDDIMQRRWRTIPIISWCLVVGRLSLRFSFHNYCPFFLFTFVLAYETGKRPSGGCGVTGVLLASVPCCPACGALWTLAKLKKLLAVHIETGVRILAQILQIDLNSE